MNGNSSTQCAGGNCCNAAGGNVIAVGKCRGAVGCRKFKSHVKCKNNVKADGKDEVHGASVAFVEGDIHDADAGIVGIGDGVVATATIQAVHSCTTVQGIVAGVTFQCVVARIACQRVVTTASGDGVGVAVSIDRVVASATEHILKIRSLAGGISVDITSAVGS